MRENTYQAGLIKRLHRMLPDCVIIKNDPQYQQGILDITILLRDRWAMLEVKASRSARQRPNQDYFVELLNGMSFAAFIFPENEEEVLDALQQALAPRRRTRVSKS
jgi:hypothetical protein